MKRNPYPLKPFEQYIDLIIKQTKQDWFNIAYKISLVNYDCFGSYKQLPKITVYKPILYPMDIYLYQLYYKVMATLCTQRVLSIHKQLINSC